MIYAENEILGNMKCLLMPGCLQSISLLTPGSTVLRLEVSYFELDSTTVEPSVSKLIDSKQPGISKHFMFPKISFSA